MIKRVVMFLLAVVAGYVTMVLLITVVQEGMFGGVTFSKTPLPQLLVAEVLTTASAVAGGAVAAWIFGKPWFPPALAVCGLVVLETTYLMLTAGLEGPLWFDILGPGTHVIGLLLGAYAIRRVQRSASSGRATASAPS